MDASSVVAALAPIKPELASFGVKQLLLVGSVARGECKPDSDLDFVVEFVGPATFLTYMDLIELLEGALGRRVDLTTLKALRPEIAATVLAEARRVA